MAHIHRISIQADDSAITYSTRLHELRDALLALWPGLAVVVYDHNLGFRAPWLRVDYGDRLMTVMCGKDFDQAAEPLIFRLLHSGEIIGPASDARRAAQKLLLRLGVYDNFAEG